MAAARFCFLLAIVLLVSSESVRGADWPAWRYGADRSASSPQNLADDLSLQWIRQFAPPKPAWPEDPRLVFDGSYEPIVVGQTLFLASAQNDAITALDTRTGKEKWKFFADGPIRFAPVADDGQLFEHPGFQPDTSACVALLGFDPGLFDPELFHRGIAVGAPSVRFFAGFFARVRKDIAHGLGRV